MATCKFGLIARAAAVLAATGPLAPAQPPTNSPPHRCIVPVQRDGPAYDRFLAINQRAQENHGRAQVIFVGDSITQGWEGNGKEVWTKYYAHRRALNLGIGSDHTQHVLWRLDHGNVDGLNPKAAVVLIGVNNIPDETNTPRQVLEGVTAVVHRLREKLPNTKVLLLGIFPFREDFNPQRGKALQVNQALHKLDDGHWVHFMDIGHLFIEPDGRISKDMMRDFLHLSPKGYRLWAEAIEPKLASLIGDNPVAPE
jgi:beta-glucosidase